MPTTAHFTVRADIVGAVAGPSQVYLPMTFSTSPGGIVTDIVVSTSIATVSITTAPGTRLLLCIPDSTMNGSTQTWRLRDSTADAGLLLSAANPALLPLSEVGTGDTKVLNFLTTGGVGSTFGMRVIQY